MTVDLTLEDGIATLVIDNPPVNALGQAVRQRLAELADQLDADPAVRAVVLTGAGRLFVGGADITEFDRPPAPPLLPDLIGRIERAEKPWIAAIHGAARGGGLELPLGCRFRVAAPDATLALPEITLGLIPGAGGTQRLPRLIGLAEAVPVITENRVLDAQTALELGLIDRIIPGPLAEGARAFAQEVLTAPLPPAAADRPLPAPEPGFWDEAAARVARSARGASAPPAALQAIRHGVEQGIAAGLQHERATFQRLRASDEAAALRYLFFAERAAARPAALRGIDPLPVRQTGVIGGGTMGVGIAAALRNAGLPVTLVERDQPTLDRGLATLLAVFEAAVTRGSLTAEAAAARMAGVTGSTDMAALAGADLVIEAVFEDLAVKRGVFEHLGRTCRPDAVLATNTSYIDPGRIAAGMAGPQRILGLHFFSPAQVMKLLEIVPTPQTSPQVLATGFDLARRLGKMPVQSGICEGFIGNRILRRARSEAEAMLREGIAVEAIDAALRGFGFAMGPFEVQDLAGLDISFLQREGARARGENVPESPGDVLVRAGRKGQKTGAGWYDYAPGERRPRPSATARALLARFMGQPAELPPETITARILGAMAEEGQRILDEGIAKSAADIDLVKVHGYGFPRGRGGPMFQSALRSKFSEKAAE